MIRSQKLVEGSSGADRAVYIRSILLNLIVNALCPYLLFRILKPHYPHGSVMPLLWSAIFPLGELTITLIRSRTLDVVSVTALLQIFVSLATTILASNVTWALIWGASQDGFIGLAFLLSLLIGFPLMRYFARQFATANDPDRIAAFDAMAAREGGRAFKVATLVWALVLIVLCAAKLALVAGLLPADYLLYGPTMGTITIVILIWWTIRYVRPRLRIYNNLAEQNASGRSAP